MANAESAGSTADAPPVRFRVSNMDCTKDAAQIARTAQSAGVAPDDVKVSAATQIMTLNTPEVRLPDIEKAAVVTGYDFDRIEDDENIPPNPGHKDPAYRRALWVVVILNVGYGVVDMIGGFIAGLRAVKADALDFSGNGAITFLGPRAIGWSVAWRARSALAQGFFLGLGVLGTTIVRVFERTTPDAGLRGLLGMVALVVWVLPLLRFRKGIANLRDVWLFSRNDAIGNAAVVIAAGLVAWLGSAWPDLIVALGITGLFLHLSWAIIRNARVNLKAPA